MKGIGIFGGTFDPIHLGHLICAQYVFETRELEKIIFVPCNKSPHKKDIISANSNNRIEMIKLSISEIPYFVCSDFEIKQDDISYTVDTLIHFKKKYENLELIIGEDNFNTFNSWKDPNKIIELAKVIVLKRDRRENHQENIYEKSVVYLDSPNIEISATNIRNRIKNKQSINFLVPEKVQNYIYDNNLYGI
ncbi:MAG: nicotinate (nicotinamide) nucleotide adenylyltransferase [Ignavibacteriales bacterium CG12_big_fil_rev_8_21_14_0_65_30_8]|nr:MAG: nicotinate (nicotinamide) nucleotide adenylyltransferase [Ignavibacteriales bacterium CG12_big_fil_rev_8_21_14_0_65_30_8]